MSSSLTQKRGRAHPVIEPDNHAKPSPFLQNGRCCRVSPRDFVSSETCGVSLGPNIPTRHESSKDDIAISSRPLRQVDYLSHHWKEEDIWSSWRYIVTGRGTLLDHVRLENAAWRTWAKVKNSLRTVRPEVLNWRKDDDITWLYGPLHLMQNPFGLIQTDLRRLPLGNADLHRQVRKKPILKRRSMSEDIFVRSSSTVSSLGQSGFPVDIQNTSSFPPLGRSRSQNLSERVSKRPESQGSNNLSQFSDSSWTGPPSREPKRTRFNERVEQCVIVDGHLAGHDDSKPDYSCHCNDSDSDDGILMRSTNTRRSPVPRRKTSQLMLYKGTRLSMLPSMALKSGYETPQQCRADDEVVHHPPVPIFPRQDISPAHEPMAISVGTGGADDILQDNVSSNSTTARPSPSSQDATGDLHRSSCSNGRFEEGVMSSRYRPQEEERAPPRGGFVSLLEKAMTSVRDVTYVVWNSTR